MYVNLYNEIKVIFEILKIKLNYIDINLVFV